MNRPKSSSLFDRLVGQSVIPVFSSDSHETNCRVLEACAWAGVELFEFTNRVPNAVELFRKLKDYADKAFPDIILGAGTVRRLEAAQAFRKAGARFIVGPNFNRQILVECLGTIPYSPGCFTPSELEEAQENLGEDAVLKLFPANVAGTDLLRSVRATNPTLRIMVTGGVKPNQESLRAWFGAGAVAVGMGSELISRSDIAEKKFKTISRAVGDALQLAMEIKSSL